MSKPDFDPFHDLYHKYLPVLLVILMAVLAVFLLINNFEYHSIQDVQNSESKNMGQYAEIQSLELGDLVELPSGRIEMVWRVIPGEKEILFKSFGSQSKNLKWDFKKLISLKYKFFPTEHPEYKKKIKEFARQY